MRKRRERAYRLCCVSLEIAVTVVTTDCLIGWIHTCSIENSITGPGSAVMGNWINTQTE